MLTNPRHNLLFFAGHSVLSVTILAGIVATCAAQETVADPDKDAVTFSRIPVDTMRAELTEWLKSSDTETEAAARLMEPWSDSSVAAMSAEESLDLVVSTLAHADPVVARLLQESFGAGPLEEVIFDGIRDAPVFRNQVQLFRARWLVQHRYYDDALPVLKALSPDEVVDPAGLLFYRALCQSELLQRTEALDSLSLLLTNTVDVPSRFRLVAKMLQEDLQRQKEEGMDNVALLMKDVERRLDLGQSGEKTQTRENDVVDALDRMLEELEEEQKNQQQGGSGSGTSPMNQPGTQGASRSQIKGAPAAGEADRKELKEGGKWGMMDQKAEAQARELIRQKFPPNFLDQIGRYTRKIAEQKK